jgi:hypothetical protein
MSCEIGPSSEVRTKKKAEAEAAPSSTRTRLQELDCSNKETKERIAVLPAVGQDKARRDRRDWRVQSELTSSKEAMISDRQDSRNELEGAGAACERMPNEPFATRWGG